MTALNLLSNSLVISVLLRYPQLREDRTALFILSMSFSDLGSGLFNILLSAGLCSNASPFLLRHFHYMPTVSGVAMWWFSFVSMYSLCWLIPSKNVAITMPFRSDQLLSRKRCHVFNRLAWLVAFCFSVVIILSEDLKFDEGTCSYTYSNDSTLQLYYSVVSVFTLFLPRALLIPPSHRRRGANAVLVRHKPQCHRHDRRGSAVVSPLIAVKPLQIVKPADIRSPYISVTPGSRCDCGACTA